MIKILQRIMFAHLLLSASIVNAQNKGAIFLPKAKFVIGDNQIWSSPSFDDQSWKEIETGKVWQSQSLGIIDNGFTSAIPPHGVKLIRVLNN